MIARIVVGAAALLMAAPLVAAGWGLTAARPVHGRLADPAPRLHYADGAPAGFSGGFGEQSCHGCHFTGDVNAAPGRVLLDGVPDRYTPGSVYVLTITLARPGMALGGFQLTARFADDGRQAGSIAPAPDDSARVRVEEDGAVQYANQTREGAVGAGGSVARWKVAWTAPARAEGHIVFHLAANAADGDGTSEGDHIYTMSAESSPATILPR